MILSCPQCRARYMIPSTSVGGEGRDVRCAKCGHEWFQEGEEDFSADIIDDSYDDDAQEGYAPDLDSDDEVDLSALRDALEGDGGDQFDDEPAFESAFESESPEFDETQQPAGYDIPDGIRPDHQQSPDEDMDDLRVRPDVHEELHADIERKSTGLGKSGVFSADKRPKKAPLGVATAYLTAFLIFSGVLGYILTQKEQMLTVFPPVAGFYTLIGMDLPLRGEGLIIENARAEVMEEGGTSVLVVKGLIMNLKNIPVQVPDIIATLKSSEERRQKGLKWRIRPEISLIDAGDSFAFTARYNAPSESMDVVQLAFEAKL